MTCCTTDIPRFTTRSTAETQLLLLLQALAPYAQSREYPAETGTIARSTPPAAPRHDAARCARPLAGSSAAASGCAQSRPAGARRLLDLKADQTLPALL